MRKKIREENSITLMYDYVMASDRKSGMDYFFLTQSNIFQKSQQNSLELANWIFFPEGLGSGDILH